jgi:hypothetical protein
MVLKQLLQVLLLLQLVMPVQRVAGSMQQQG